MLWDKYRPLYAPETEGATEAPEAAPIPLNERPVDGPGSGRGELRKQLEKSVETVRASEEKKAKAEQPKPTKARGPNHQETETEEVSETPEATRVSEDDVETTPEEKVEAAPEAFTKEAKGEWAKTPATVRAAILKREQDMEKGVTEIKKKYSDLDQILGPRTNIFRQYGKTPAQAVGQMFAWFDALGSNPDTAFPALAQSFRFDLNKLAPQQQGTEKPTEQAAEIPDPVKQYIAGLEAKLEQKFGGLAQQVNQQFNQQSQSKTQEILDMWSKDKPYFEEVRQHMAHLISSGAVQALPNGAADLDTAYDMASHAIPGVRARMMAEQDAARQKEAKEKADKERKAQQEQADKARRASGGTVSSGAPGSPPVPGKKGGKAKSVRESLMEARAELED